MEYAMKTNNIKLPEEIEVKKELKVCSICLRNNSETEWSVVNYLCKECQTKKNKIGNAKRWYRGRQSRVELCKHYGNMTEDGNTNFYLYEKALLEGKHKDDLEFDKSND